KDFLCAHGDSGGNRANHDIASCEHRRPPVCFPDCLRSAEVLARRLISPRSMLFSGCARKRPRPRGSAQTRHQDFRRSASRAATPVHNQGEIRMDIEMNTELETKAGLPPDAVVTHAEMMRAFEEFKQTNDQRLAGIERRSVDVLVNEKLARIDQTIDAQVRRLDEIVLKNSRPSISGERLRGSPEHKMAFENYVRSGENANLRA